MRGLSRASPSTGHFPTGFRRVAFGADRPCCDRLDAGLAHQPSSRTHVAPRTMVRRGAGSPKSSFSEIRTLAAGAAGAEIERRVRKTAVLYGGGTTGSNPSSSGGESATNRAAAASGSRLGNDPRQWEGGGRPARYLPSRTTGLLRVPMPVISMSIVSRARDAPIPAWRRRTWMAVEVTDPSHISPARRMSALAGSDGSSAFQAVSAPQTGSVAASISPSCASTEAWSQ